MCRIWKALETLLVIMIHNSSEFKLREIQDH
ncbi:unnamed protein product [Spirodela intermedia]|uniref:Uncharacterized protein n=1 Tax=Spirodela intermedia TaxID=51605 RepID=A0A7I8K2S8_SPIIN|nr:unnamed protein product [Spirodela intermedia]